MNIVLRKTTDYRSVLNKCYYTDAEFICDYHSLKGNIDAEGAIERELSVMVQMSESDTYNVYEMYVNERFAGYFGIEKLRKTASLSGFFILPEFRTKEFIKRFWQVVKSKFSGEINCILYLNNIRAIRFIERTGFKKASLPFPINNSIACLFVK